MIVPVPRGAGDNRGEDLRFPISSSSGFSSPMEGPRRNAGSDFLFRQLPQIDQHFCFPSGSKLIKIELQSEMNVHPRPIAEKWR